MGRQARSYGQKKGLNTGQFLIQDTAPTSQYFKLHDIPESFTSGKNLFKIEGNRNLLAPSQPIIIEILDFNGNPIYHDVLDYLEPGTNFRYVVPYIYPDTAPGPCQVILAGIATRRPNGSPVSKNFEGSLNVRFTKEIPVRPDVPNSTEILNLQTPRLQIREKIRSYVVPVSGESDVQRVRSASNISYALEANQQTFTSQKSQTSTLLQALQSIKPTATSPEPFFSSSMLGAALKFPAVAPELASNQQLLTLNSGVAPPKIYNEITSQAYEPIITKVINSKKVELDPPLQSRVETTIPVPKGFDGPPLSANTVITPESFPASPATCSYTDYNVPFTTTSTNTVSFAKIALSNIEPACGQIKQVRTSMRSLGFHQFAIMDLQDISSKELLTKDDNLGLQEKLGFFTTQSIVKEYYKLRPSKDSSVGYWSSFDGSVLSGQFARIGILASLAGASVNTDALDQRSSQVKLMAKDDVLTDGLSIRPPEIFPGAHTLELAGVNESFSWNPYLNSSSYWAIHLDPSKDIDDDGETAVNGLEGGIYVNAGNTYQISFKLAMAQSPAAGTSPDSHPDATYVQDGADYSLLRQPKIDFVLTGSAFDVQAYAETKVFVGETVECREYKLAEFDYRNIITSSTASITPPTILPGSSLEQAGPLQIDEESSDLVPLPAAGMFDTGSQLVDSGVQSTSTPDFDTHVFEFSPPLNGYMTLVMKYYGGDITISEISVKSLDLRGFTPNHTYIEFEVPSFQSDDVLEFKFDMLDNNGNIITTFTTQSSAFVGSNQYLDNGQINGNVNIGDGIIMEGFQ